MTLKCLYREIANGRKAKTVNKVWGGTIKQSVSSLQNRIFLDKDNKSLYTFDKKSMNGNKDYLPYRIVPNIIDDKTQIIFL